MKVTGVTLESSTTTTLSAFLDGFPLWFRFPAGIEIQARGDPFVPAAVLEAMGRGEPVEIDESGTVCPQLLAGVRMAQEVYHCWNPELRPVEVACTQLPSSPKGRVGAFFSGGVDSMYTLLKEQDELTDLIFLTSGYDFEDNSEVRAIRVAMYQEFADKLGKRLVAVESNFRSFADSRKLQWDLAHGFCLYSIALALGFQRVLIPSSHTYAELFPWGSHPMTDPLWSNCRTTLVHHGAGLRRSEKLHFVANYPEAMRYLRVCWRSSIDNCGLCPKCLRTLLSLHLLSLPRTSFPAVAVLEHLDTLRVTDGSALTFLEDNLLLAREVRDKRVVRRLEYLLWQWRLKELMVLVDQVFLAGVFRRLYRHNAKPEWLNLDVTLLPHQSPLKW